MLQEKNVVPNIEETLRPTYLDQFIGQDKVKQGLRVFIDAAKERKEALSHVLLYGPPGLGKTTLASIIAKEMGVDYRVTSGPALARMGDLAALLSNLEEGDVLFIDEIHRLNRSVEEVLYPAMEDFALDIILGKGPTAKTLRLDLPKFTLVGATTKVGSLSSPLRDRFGVMNQLAYYTNKDIERILIRSAGILNIVIDQESIEMLASRSRHTPRIANRLLNRVRDYAQVSGNKVIDSKTAYLALELLDIDSFGLDSTDRKVLDTIITKFQGGPVGIRTLAAAIHEDPETLEEMVEPFLLQLGFLDRTSQGRKVTSAAMEHLALSQAML